MIGVRVWKKKSEDHGFLVVVVVVMPSYSAVLIIQFSLSPFTKRILCLTFPNSFKRSELPKKCMESVSGDSVGHCGYPVRKV